MVIGSLIIDILGPILEFIAPFIPGEVFPLYFTKVYYQRPLIAAIVVSIVAGFLGAFLLIRNLALIGDGLAHVTFGGIAIGLVVGWVDPLWWALGLSIVAAILIDFLSYRKWITGDTAIAIFLTGMLGLGIVVTRIWGGGSLASVEGYLWGSLNLIDEESYNFIVAVCFFAYILLIILYRSILAISIDSIAARVQGLPVPLISLLWSILIALVVVSMVQIVGVLLVTALLVTPAAIAQLVSRSFLTCVILSQIFGVITVLLGLYYSTELGTGSGSMIALVSAVLFVIVAISKALIKVFFLPKENAN